MQMLYDAIQPDALERMQKIFREERETPEDVEAAIRERAAKLDAKIREDRDRQDELADRAKHERRKVGAG